MRNPEGHAAYLGTRTFASLDGLRALSILGVIWHHTVNHAAPWPALRRGFLGVDLFFVISGFLIVTLLLRECRASGSISLRRFYVRRSLRIVPAYWALLVLVACAAYARPAAELSAALKHDLPYALFYVSNLVPMASLLAITWSLSSEEQFYLVVPALSKYAPRIFPRLILPLMYVAAILPPFGWFAQVGLPAFFRQTTFGPILLGVMLAHVLDSPRGWTLAARLLGHPLAPLAALALLAATLCYPGADISGWPRLSIQIAMLILLASCVVRENHVLAPFLTMRSLARIGAVSYGMYLYHLLVYSPVSKMLDRAGVASTYALFAGVTLGTWITAELSYRLFEARFLALKARFVPARARVRTPAESSEAA